MCWKRLRSAVLLGQVVLFVGLAATVHAQTVRGRLAMAWTELDAPDPAIVVWLTDGLGVTRELELDAAQLQTLRAQNAIPGGDVEVVLSSEVRPLRLGADAVPRYRVRSLFVHAPATQPSAGARRAGAPSTPFVTLLCKFADITAEPWTAAEVGATLGTQYPGAGHFFGELSDGGTPLAGSTAVGWFTVPQPRSFYVQQYTSYLATLASHCAMAADPTVDFTQFYGVNFQFNGPLHQRPVPPYDILSVGGSAMLGVEGVSQLYPATWLSVGHAFNYAVVMHEMGHAMGWPHSSGMYGQTYDSRWDIMSAGYIYYDPVFGWLGPHTVAHHLQKVGWIAPGKLWQGGPGASAGIVLERTALPTSNGYQAAILPFNDGTGRFYTVESRKTAGYDRNLPADGVLIHIVDPSLVDREAQVVDQDNNGDPNDSGAYWLPGEVFDDPVRNLFVVIDSATATGYGVTLGAPRFAIFPATRHDSVPAGAAVAMVDSTLLRFTAAATASAWTVSHRSMATWNTVLTPSGQGDATIRWQRSPAGLSPGLYVDTIVVNVSNGVGSPSQLIDSLVVLRALSVAVLPGSDADSALVGSTAVQTDSSEVVLTGVNSAATDWAATHGPHAWLSLTTASGTGSGRLRWTRDPTGLAVGTYVDTIGVQVAGAQGSPARLIDTLRVAGFPVIAAGVTHRADSLLAGSTTPQRDSVAVTVTGFGAAAINWTASHGAAGWLTFTSGAGTGTGFIKWIRDPTGLPLGTYVDTVNITTAGTTGGPIEVLDSLRIVLPAMVLAASSRRDSTTLGSQSLRKDSVAVTLTGLGNAQAGWTATHGASTWLTLTTAAGTGSSRVRWTRNPTGLAVGSYVDTITVSGSGALGGPLLLLDSLRVFEPVVASSCGAGELFGSPCLTALQRAYLDDTGNRDGSYNLGDLLAFLDRKGLPLSPLVLELIAADTTRRAPRGGRRP